MAPTSIIDLLTFGAFSSPIPDFADRLIKNIFCKGKIDIYFDISKTDQKILESGFCNKNFNFINCALNFLSGDLPQINPTGFEQLVHFLIFNKFIK